MTNLSIAGLRIQRSLIELEAAIEAAMTAASTLNSDLLMARSVEGAPPAAGQAVLIRMGAAQQSLLKASSDTFRMHGDLRKLNEDVKALPAEDGECPDRHMAEAPGDREQAVA
jgi:hypothetical protein